MQGLARPDVVSPAQGEELEGSNSREATVSLAWGGRRAGEAPFAGEELCLRRTRLKKARLVKPWNGNSSRLPGMSEDFPMTGGWPGVGGEGGRETERPRERKGEKRLFNGALHLLYLDRLVDQM